MAARAAGGGPGSGDGQSSGADEEPKASGGAAGSDKTGGTEDVREAGDGVPVSDESSPSTGTSMLPFLIAAALLFAAGLIILFADRKRRKRGRKPARVQEPPTAEVPNIGW